MSSSTEISIGKWRNGGCGFYSQPENHTHSYFAADLGTSIDLKSADKELKAVTPEKSKTCVTAFTKKLVTTLQL